jgi:hypothetical protein
VTIEDGRCRTPIACKLVAAAASVSVDQAEKEEGILASSGWTTIESPLCPFQPVQKVDRSQPSRPESTRTEDRSQSRLQGHQHHDRPRHAGFPSDRLIPEGKGEIRPNADFCTIVYLW